MSFYRGNPLKVGIASVAALLVLIVLAITINASFGLPFNLSLFPPGQDYAVKAAFTDANGVIRGADVVVAGHTVGQVTGVEVHGKQAVVSMRVARQYAPLHRFTTARIRYSTLLAQKYVEITPVNGGPEIASGGQISSDSTLSPVDFDQFLSALDPETRLRLQTLIQQAGGGIQGQQQVINDLLSQTHGLSQESLAPLQTFHQHDPDIDRIIANLAIVSNRLAASHQQLGELINGSSQVTGTLAQNDQALASLIAHLGNVMGDFNATLAGNEKNLHDTVVGLDPLLGQLNGTLSLVYTDLHGSLAQINTNTNVLTPESVSAVSQQGDAQGNVLRQLFVLQPDCGTPGTTCQTGPSQSQPNVLAPVLPSLPNLPLCIPTPSPPKLPTPSLPALPCPSISAPPLPTPSCLPATPKLPKVPTPSASVCPSVSVPGLPLPTLPPIGAIPDWLRLLLGAE